LSHTVIAAPVDGIVISRNVDVGQTVAASMSAPVLFEIAKDLTAMQVNASIDEADIGRIEHGQRVTFKVDAYPKDAFTGTVSQVRLDPVVSQNVVSYVTIIDVPNRDLKLKPGMTANVSVEVARADDVVRVPNAALRFVPTEEMLAAVVRNDQQPRAGNAAPARPAGEGSRRQADESMARVWTLQEGQLRPVRVRTGTSDGVLTAIVGGELAEGVAIVTGMSSSATAASSQRTSSPLIPQRPGGTRPSGSNTRPQGSGR
jgi:HlyD family secretion protein